MIRSDIVIIGGGFYGLFIAEYFAKQGKKVVLLEKEASNMRRASYVNQARVHNGYHYPRSTLTALRSRVSFPVFTEEFRDCIVNDFDKYYLVGKNLGKVSAKQFQGFCKRIGAPIEQAPEKIRMLTNPQLIEDVFLTKEWAFDAVKLASIVEKRAENSGVEILNSHKVTRIKQQNNTLLTSVDNDLGGLEIESKQVFNCTYSSINQINIGSKIDLVPLKHELTEMCLVSVPEEIKGMAFTVMCGPFFSLMPFPSTDYYSLSHVRYTPHYEWYDDNKGRYTNAHSHMASAVKNTAWNSIILDAQRYIPSLKDCLYKDSLWEVKTVLPASEVDDSRPILFKKDYGLKGYHCVMGGKIDNVYDVISKIREFKLDE